MAQAFGTYVLLAIEYGFSLSATREVARAKSDRQLLARLLTGVAGAQAFLILLLVPVPWLVASRVPILQGEPLLVGTAFVWGIAQGSSLAWFFQGLERMRVVAALDLGARVLTTAGIFLVVRNSGDAIAVLVLQAAASTATLVVGWTLAMREVSWYHPSIRDSREALRLGWSMFVFRGAVSLYTVGNVFVLGLFASPQVVGYYAGAEKIARAVQGLLGPISQTLYPRISRLIRESREQAARLARSSLHLMGVLGLVLCAVLAIWAPMWTRLILGPAFEPAAPTLRVLALILPLVAVSNALGIQWMPPLGLDRIFNAIIIGAGLLNIVLAVMLAPRFGGPGMAFAVLSSELFVAGLMYGYLRWRRVDPDRLCAPAGGGSS
jgi:PST family polysaccharide transporter